VLLLRRLKPRLVHVNLTDQGDGIVPVLAARLARVPVVATLHLVLPGRPARLEALSRLTLRMAARVIAVSEFVADYLRASGIEPALVRNGVAPTLQDPEARSMLGVDAGDYVVGGIGRLDRQKGWDVLCAAAPLVRERVPRARLVVVGDGPERRELAELGRRTGVSFAGYREHAASLIGGFDVLVVPSRYEGFGLVVVEAMLAGVPVVASAADSLPEVVADAGRVVPVDDPTALAEAIASLAEDRALAAGLVERGRRRAQSLFARGRMAEETLAVWSEAVGAPLS
jgi:glycosyltransferase involved in cell wall biosynthesis